MGGCGELYSEPGAEREERSALLGRRSTSHGRTARRRRRRRHRGPSPPRLSVATRQRLTSLAGCLRACRVQLRATLSCWCWLPLHGGCLESRLALARPWTRAPRMMPARVTWSALYCRQVFEANTARAAVRIARTAAAGRTRAVQLPRPALSSPVVRVSCHRHLSCWSSGTRLRSLLTLGPGKVDERPRLLFSTPPEARSFAPLFPSISHPPIRDPPDCHSSDCHKCRGGRFSDTCPATSIPST